VLAAGATEGNRQITLALTDIVWKEIYQKVGNSTDKFNGLGE
jgi:hypothetical protein